MHSSLCPPASWCLVFCDPLSHCWSLSSPPLSLFPFLSAVCSCLLCGMLFINLTTMTVSKSRTHWQCFFESILVSCSDVWVSERKLERPLTVLYVSVLQVWCVWSLARLWWNSWCCSVLRLVDCLIVYCSQMTLTTLCKLSLISNSIWECFFFKPMIIAVTQEAVMILICAVRHDSTVNERIADVIQYLLFKPHYTIEFLHQHQSHRNGL